MKIKLLDQVRETARLKHLSLRTEEAYVQWIKRYVLFHKKASDGVRRKTRYDNSLHTPNKANMCLPLLKSKISSVFSPYFSSVLTFSLVLSFCVKTKERTTSQIIKKSQELLPNNPKIPCISILLILIQLEFIDRLLQLFREMLKPF